MNVAQYLERHAAQTPDLVAIRFEGRSISYGQLNSDANRLASSLRAAGVKAADRVALYLPNVPEFAVAYYAAQKLGAIPVTINAILKMEEVRYLLDDSGASVVVTMDELTGYVSDDCTALRLRIVVDPKGTKPGWAGLTDLLASGSDKFESVQRSPEDIAALLYSSGTTGFPKGVSLTQHNIHSNIALPPL
ncbi:MAG: AMP-binding protein, partial [Burkholderiales bacterium]|nr:AMP-binding protein [Burkholderiales bacterium]